jgi:4-hydroxy-tetrahydrodipicolinate synthase
LRYAAEHIAGADPDVMLTVGVDTQVVHGYVNCGAVGAITGVGNVLPREVLQLEALSKKAAKGDAEALRRAEELDRALGILSSFDEGPDLVLFYKHLMVIEGNPEYELHFCATDALSTSQKSYAESQLKLFKNWYRSWSKTVE